MSPLAWGRGSKPLWPVVSDAPKLVAPRVGAWIETESALSGIMVEAGRPSRGGVDRNFRRGFADDDYLESPLAWGAWIETMSPTCAAGRWSSPLAWGAWIETATLPSEK